MKYIVLLGLWMGSFFCGYGQQPSATDVIRMMSDSLRIRYPHHFDVKVRNNDTVFYRVDKENRQIDIGIPVDQFFAKHSQLFSLLDSLAQTASYNNKLLAHEIYLMVLQVTNRQDFNKRERPVILNIISSDIKYCLRIQGASALHYVRTSLFSETIQNDIEKLFQEPLLSKEEATILSQRNGPLYQLSDTIGFAHQDARFHTLSVEEKYKVRKIRIQCHRANVQHQSLAQYYDSLNQIQIQRFIQHWIHQPFLGKEQVLREIGDNRLVTLAPVVETTCHSLLKDNMDFDCRRILARLQYKTYARDLIKEMKCIIDTCQTYLQRPNLSMLDKKRVEKIGDRVFYALDYIGSQDAYYVAAPLLQWHQEVVNDFGDAYTPAARFFLLLNERIKNFPWNERRYARIKKGDPLHVVDEWYIDHKMEAGFLTEMYHWMLTNKGHYRIIEN